MSFIAAEISDPYQWKNKPAPLSGQFEIRAVSSTIPHGQTNQNAITTSTSSKQGSEETDSLDLLAPETLSLKQQILQKLEKGLEGEAYNLLMEELDGRELDHVIETLAEFKYEFEERGFNDLAKDIGQVIQALSNDYFTPEATHQIKPPAAPQYTPTSMQFM